MHEFLKKKKKEKEKGFTLNGWVGGSIKTFSPSFCCFQCLVSVFECGVLFLSVFLYFSVQAF